MYDPENTSTSGDPKLWLSTGAGDDLSSPALRRLHSQLTAASAAAGANGNVDRILFNDLVEMVPLVQSLIDRKANSSFARRGSMTYTKTPSRESLSRRMVDPKGRNVAQKKRDQGDKDQGKAGRDKHDADSFSIFPTRAFSTEKDMEELATLREQLADLQGKLLEKDELLKSAEASKNQLNSVHAKLEELKLQAAEKDSVIRSTQLQLSDAKIKLADKTAALEKIQWEAMTANRKAEQLQQELDSTQANVSSVLSLLEGLMDNNSTIRTEEYDVEPFFVVHINDLHANGCWLLENLDQFQDDLDQTKMQQMEEARQAYVAAVTAAKERKDEESLAAAACARKHLQSFSFGSKI